MSDIPNPTAATTDAAAVEPKKHKLVTLGRFSMTAPLPNGTADQKSRMYWGSFRGNPRIIVQTNDPQDSENNYGKINGNMDMDTFGVLCSFIEEAIKAEPGFKRKIVNLSLYKGRERFETPTPVNSTLIGKDTDGRIWISVVEDSRPTPRFFFGPSEYHQAIRQDGSPVPPGELSALYAHATLEGLKRIFAVLHARNVLGDEPDEEGKVSTGNAASADGSGGRGGWNGQKQGGNNWQQRQGGGGGGGFQRGGGGGGYQQRGGGGGWQGRPGGGGGGYQQRHGGGGGNWNNNRPQGGAPAPAAAQSAVAQNDRAAAAVAMDDLTF